MLTLDIEIVEKHAEATATLYRVSTGILKKPLGFSSRFSSRLLYVRSFYIRLFRSRVNPRFLLSRLP